MAADSVATLNIDPLLLARWLISAKHMLKDTDMIQNKLIMHLRNFMYIFMQHSRENFTFLMCTKIRGCPEYFRLPLSIEANYNLFWNTQSFWDYVGRI